MNLKIALFGIAREIVGQSALEVSAPEGQSARGLLQDLHARYPELARLSSLAVAVNNEYAAEDAPLREHDEIALIPPVSGG
ncbi:MULTISPECIES: molybdopterin converting factor subunit 1 [Hymenobacter]|uniref:Molybdopterin synthase sulfur carrier subunit n=1 Tax=Hymenobacter guriensis TaxID=2793065 RepID=A0ABS0L2I1_9BACT|nr:MULTISPECIES: molybdopterin converting factor subunit 1 [Hymenobacter]MBG8554286.1 molybdopterin converting factor subunit 1 [Hymenobacter guriensis]MCR5887433.1 molybdopterin converting factor subunit 1 [Hymenobacter sp. J193]